jgi:hypothetical protein
MLKAELHNLYLFENSCLKVVESGLDMYFQRIGF